MSVGEVAPKLHGAIDNLLKSAPNLVVSSTPSGSAGGDLGGTYPNPTVITIADAVGTILGGNATAGNIGEYVTAYGSNITQGTSAQFTNVCSISLTAGDWDLAGCIVMNIGSTVLNSFWSAATSAFSGNTTTDHVLGDNWLAGYAATGGSDASQTVAAWRVNITTTTTYYLKGAASWATAAPTYYGRLSARRVR